MIADLAACLAEGFAAPRRSLRRFLDAGPHRVDVLLSLVLAGYLVQALAAIAIPGGRMDTGGSVVTWHMAGMVFQLIICGASAGMVYAAGRVFGGEGGFEDCLAGMIWYNFITAFLSPFVLIGWSAVLRGDGGAGSGFLLLMSVGLAIWVFASHVAEIHAFRSTGAVVAATMAFLMATSMLLFSMTQGA